MEKYKGFVKYKELYTQKRITQGNRIFIIDRKKGENIGYKVYNEDRVVKGALSWKVNKLLKNKSWYVNGFESLN